MYIVCRLGGARDLPDVYARLRDELARGSSSALHSAPSLPAYAYATAKRLSVGEGLDADGLESIPWMQTPEHDSPDYGGLLDRIRSELDPVIAEALELHHARGLAIDDIAYVMGLASPDAARAVADGGEQVRDFASSLDSEPAVDVLIRDAFRPQTVVDPATTERLPRRVPRLSEGTLIGGRFEISSVAQTTASQSIYLANDTSVTGQSIVLHLLHRSASTTSARTGMLRTLRLLDWVAHPSIGRILGYGWHADRLWYATPWYEGHTLEQLVQRGALSSGEAIDIFVPLARGLAALHQSGVVHRDISLDKILLLQIGTKGAYETLAVLSGFDAWLNGEVLVAEESRVLAPEVARRLSEGGQVGAGANSEDVFSLGLALLCALEPGARPGSGEPWSAFLIRRATAPVEVPASSRVGPFSELLTRALSVDPHVRPTAAEFASGLERLAPSVSAKRNRRRLFIPASIVAAAAALLLVAVFVRQSRLRLIEETQRGADAVMLSEELEAEKARSKQLEAELEGGAAE